ncbi:MarR family transcriptional regulator [Rhizobium leguminosarum bv. trifolii CB782]|uniref:MarR family transcriptional regulator n=1 Tax=Rhizobium hidalgonense TaxID=1538159 RepID=A0A2A6KKY9_9HYPH|nr:MarR family transcriptional regulator [Rhizobium hidalgonense]AHG45826.1 MarR family transcriptional regulator [Rhizobium leguminosarum bv. trifolii CB782]EJC76609.1 transcriptional regulator [Rhizobium leguminosarum bv. trifolii WSM2012]MDR9771573.1 MarR family transcriptional regulator [Rhizobium hidalgonense]MDR9803374.1 MarR family transcriptional regulator [Rhizobium hidalgonense]MDR9808857.1 MarR family transcriptional regulator [Rhizobium hidalgonense]
MPTSKTAKQPETPSPNAPGADGRKLSNFLCFAVYSANLAFGRAYKPVLDALGLTYTQYIALVALSEGDDQTVSMLGEKLFLESNTLTPILKKLESVGYLTRHRDPADERQVRVSLTPAGRNLLLDVDPNGTLIAATGLGDDFPVVQKSVTRLRDNLLQAQAEPEKS